jgi:outer membrane protein TolC
MGQTIQTGVLLYDQFVLQNQGVLEGEFRLDYTLLDFGARQERIARQRTNVLAANFGFNNTHRRIIFEAMSSYYQLLNANGQRRAAEVNLENARTVQEASEARLQHGLATLPDVLEARSAAAQAEYELQSTIGMQETASGDLATLLTASPASQFRIGSIDAIQIPDSVSESTDDLIKHALAQRPDLLARLADVQGAEADVRGARSAYYPSLSFTGSWGRLRAFGEQPPYPGTYAAANVYNAQLSLGWTIFDGGRRRGELERAKAAEKRAESEADAARDHISDEVWRSYSNLKTALKQRQSARTFLDASTTSFQAALESYNCGVRNLLDVLSAQRSLAQARSADIGAQARVLTSFADLAYRTADILHTNPGAKP